MDDLMSVHEESELRLSESCSPQVWNQEGSSSLESQQDGRCAVWPSPYSQNTVLLPFCLLRARKCFRELFQHSSCQGNVIRDSYEQPWLSDSPSEGKWVCFLTRTAWVKGNSAESSLLPVCFSTCWRVFNSSPQHKRDNVSLKTVACAAWPNMSDTGLASVQQCCSYLYKVCVPVAFGSSQGCATLPALRYCST